nr:LOW QUALITY PROTEIN: long-chain-fatty-acid--CoA ligase-like [Nerophis lumbriciformis]
MTYPGAHAESTPDKVALILAGSGETMTYRELNDRSNQLAQLFRAEGLKDGDHVALWAENNLDYFVVYWAALRSGLYITAVNRFLSAEEGGYILNDSGAQALVATTRYQQVATEALAFAPGCTLNLLIGGADDTFSDFDEAIAALPAEPLTHEPMGSFMLYSSGTTGQPKGIKRPRPTTTIQETPPTTSGFMRMLGGMDENTVYLCPAPLYHAAPLAWTAGIHELGGTAVIMEKFDPQLFMQYVAQYGVTATQVVPTMFVRMLKLDQETRTAHDLSSLTFCVHAAAPCPVPVKQQMIEWWGPIIHEYYAGTEGNGMTYIGPQDWLEHPGSVGKPMLGVLRICDDEGDEVPAGEAGTVYFERDEMPFEYHGAPDKTSAAQHPKHPTWSALGDIGYVDDEGFLFLTDRKAFMIISGGVNIYPQEIEDCLVMHDKVTDVAVFGLPDPEMGEYVHAAVQPADGVEATDELASELLAYVRESIAHYKVPRVLDFRSELPRLPTGKLYKRLLKDEYLQASS